MVKDESQDIDFRETWEGFFFYTSKLKKGEEMSTKAYWSVHPRKNVPGFDISLIAVEHCSSKRPHFYHEKTTLVDPYTGYFDPIDPEITIYCAIFLVYLSRPFSRSIMKNLILSVERCLRSFLKKQGLTFNWVPGFKTTPHRNYYGFLGKLGLVTANYGKSPARGEILLITDRVLIISIFSTDLHVALNKYKKYIQEGVHISLN